MLQITIPEREFFDERTNEFVSAKEQTLTLEHSLVSLSKWESKWCKPFLDKKEKTREETIDYIRCMTLTKNVDPSTYNNLTNENLKQVEEYISAPMTATTISDKSTTGKGEIVTAEIIYYWMIGHNIPFECQKWHLNRLLTLVRVCGIKSSPPKNMGKGEILRQNAALNAARRKKLNTRG